MKPHLFCLVSTVKLGTACSLLDRDFTTELQQLEGATLFLVLLPLYHKT